ncbi:MAG: hypothetical protein PF636_09660 [Actinomycetota bacterium]|jgi:hypothetical protein|nr:hypothetical protein [Actinomycetota bacterium]
MAISKSGSTLVVAIMLSIALLLLPGCAQPAPENGAISESTVPELLGPYPMNVTVWIGHIGLTLESVRVAPSGGASNVVPYDYAAVEPTSPAGSRFVDVTVRVEGLDREYSEGFLDPLSNPVVVAEGITIPLAVGVDTLGADSSSFTTRMAFAVPDGAESAILHLPLRFETSEVATFRLW